MLGFLLFVLTIAGTPHYPVLFLIIVYTWIKRRTLVLEGLKDNKELVRCIAAIIILITLNALLHGRLQIPNMYLMPFCFMCSLGMKKEDAVVFANLIAFECVIGFFEYISGVNSFLPGVEIEAFSSDELMYFKRVYGLSNNSSFISEKILFSILLVTLFKTSFTKRKKNLLIFLYIIGLYVTFNRTAILAALLFVFLLSFGRIRELVVKNIGLASFVLIFMISLFALIAIKYGDEIISQFMRGGDEVDLEAGLTGRPIIWAAFFVFISNHIFFGNGSIHYMVPYADDRIAHAHNSFIQLYADHGIFIASFYLFALFRKINKQNLKYCLPIFFMSLFQYCAFWGFSIPDVFLFAFLCNKRYV